MTPEITADNSIEPQKAAPSTAGMTTKVVKGSMWTLAGQVAPLGVSLFTTPFVIRLLGSEGYGVFTLIGLIPTYLAFADFGMSMASTKFGSEAYAEGDSEKEARIVRTAALIGMASSLPFGILLFAFSGWIVTVFGVPNNLAGEASIALKFASAAFVVNFLNGIVNTPQLTRLRMDLNTFITSGFRILSLIATPIVIYMGFGLVGVFAALFIMSVLTLAAHLWVSERLLRDLFEWSFDSAAGSVMRRFGGAFSVSRIAAVLLANSEKGILAATVSASALAHYSVAYTLAAMMTLFTLSLNRSLVPAFSQLLSPEKRDQLDSLYSRGIRLTFIWLIPMLALLGLVARPFFEIWAGEEFARESTLPFYLLLAGVAFNILASLPNAALFAAGKTPLLAKLYWLELLPYAVIVWYLASEFGAVGAAAAWSLRVIADAFLQFLFAKRVGGVTVRFKSPGRLFLAAAVMLLPLGLALILGSINVIVILTTACCIAIYSLVVIRLGLEQEETAWLSTKIGRFGRIQF